MCEDRLESQWMLYTCQSSVCRARSQPCFHTVLRYVFISTVSEETVFTALFEEGRGAMLCNDSYSLRRKKRKERSLFTTVTPQHHHATTAWIRNFTIAYGKDKQFRGFFWQFQPLNSAKPSLTTHSPIGSTLLIFRNVSLLIDFEWGGSSTACPKKPTVVGLQ